MCSSMLCIKVYITGLNPCCEKNGVSEDYCYYYCKYFVCLSSVGVVSDDSFIRRGNHLEQRDRLGLGHVPKGRNKSRTPPPEPTNALQKVEVRPM